MATHSSILAWEIPWIEEPSRILGFNSRPFHLLTAFPQASLLYLLKLQFLLCQMK